MKAMAIALAALTASPVASAIEVGGVTLPDSWSAGSQALVLNGAGVREYGWLKIDVYAAALYLPQRSGDAEDVLASPGPKVLSLQLLHGASAKDTVEAWAPYFAGNCAAPCTLPRAQLDAFNALVPSTQKGDVVTYLFERDTVTLSLNGKVLGRVEGGGFARLLLSSWIGAMPTTPELKAALLHMKTFRGAAQ